MPEQAKRRWYNPQTGSFWDLLPEQEPKAKEIGLVLTPTAVIGSQDQMVVAPSPNAIPKLSTPMTNTPVSPTTRGAIGVVKGGASAVLGMAELASRGIQSASNKWLSPKVTESMMAGRILPDPERLKAAREQLQPEESSPWYDPEKTGFALGRLGVSALPGVFMGGAGSTVVQAATAGSKLGSLGNATKNLLMLAAEVPANIASGIAASGAYGKTDPEEALQEGYNAAQLGAALQVILGGGAKQLARKIEAVNLKPQAFLDKGMTPQQFSDLVFKNKVGGSVQATVEKSATKMNNAYNELKTILDNAKQQWGAGVDFDDIRQTLMQQYRNNPKAQKALDTIEQALEFQFNRRGIQNPLTANTDILNAQRAKQSIGEFGSWRMNPSGTAEKMESSELQAVANDYYRLVKESIENASGLPDRVKQLNKELGELQLINRVAVHRLSQAEQQVIAPYLDLLGFAYQSPALVGAGIVRRGLQSGNVANLLQNTAKLNVSRYAAPLLETGKTYVIPNPYSSPSKR